LKKWRRRRRGRVGVTFGDRRERKRRRGRRMGWTRFFGEKLSFENVVTLVLSVCVGVSGHWNGHNLCKSPPLSIGKRKWTCMRRRRRSSAAGAWPSIMPMRSWAI